MNTTATDPAHVTADPRQILHDVFGYAAFRGQQGEIIEHVAGGGDALVLMPTGGGKSLCYQVPAIAAPPRRAGCQRGGVAADRADARPGQRTRRTRRACQLPQLHARQPRRDGHRARAALGPAGAAVCGAGAHPDAALPGDARFAARAPVAQPVRHRRGALRQPVGPRLPRGISRPERAARALCRRAAHRADRHRRRPHPRRHRAAAAAGRRTHLRQQLRPAEHPLRHRREGQAARAVAALPARRT